MTAFTIESKSGNTIRVFGGQGNYALYSNFDLREQRTFLNSLVGALNVDAYSITYLSGSDFFNMLYTLVYKNKEKSFREFIQEIFETTVE